MNREQLQKNPRALWRPKLPMLDKPCPSCPFSEGNDKEFSQVVKRLDPSLGGINLVAATAAARINLFDEAQHHGDFSCHHTAYDKDMSVVPVRQHKQCPGAAKVFVDAGAAMVRRASRTQEK